MAHGTPCPCGSGQRYADCCERFHGGEAEAPDAEALMRSRYAAFTLRRYDYLWRTLHADHVLRAHTETDVIADFRRTSAPLRYMGLTILDRVPADADGIARVLFVAKIFERGRDVSFAEASEFRHDGVGWRYVSGEAVLVKDLRIDPSTLTLDSFARVVEARSR